MTVETDSEENENQKTSDPNDFWMQSWQVDQQPWLLIQEEIDEKAQTTVEEDDELELEAKVPNPYKSFKKEQE